LFKLKKICGDERTIEYQEWSAWLKEATKLQTRYSKMIEGDEAFYYSEVTSVGTLNAAASVAGLTSLMEYYAIKRGKYDKRKNRDGRHDLFISSKRKSWVFEFKQITSKQDINHKDIKNKFNEAISDAKCAQHYEADQRVSGLIINSNNWYGENIANNNKSICTDFIKSLDNAFAWEIHDTDNSSSTFFIFQLIT